MKLQLEEMGGEERRGEADTLYMKNKATFGCCRLLLVFSQLYKYTTSSAHLTSISKILRAHFNSRIIMSSLPRFLLLSLLLNSIFFFIHTCAGKINYKFNPNLVYENFRFLTMHFVSSLFR